MTKLNNGLANYQPHTCLQLALHNNGKLYVATQSPSKGVVWEVCPLFDGHESPKYPPVDYHLHGAVVRPSWAVDFYQQSVWELACLQYDSIGA